MSRESKVHTCPLLPCGEMVVLAPADPITIMGAIQLAHPKNSHRGTVVAIGPDVAIELKTGQEVCYGRWLSEVAQGDGVWLLVKQDDVLAVLA